MECKKAIVHMHDYLDGDLEYTEGRQLQLHLDECVSCRGRLKELEQADAFIRALPRTSVPPQLADRIMQAIPERKTQRNWFRWLQRYPALSVAAAFLLIVFASMLSLWDQDSNLMVQGADLDQVVIEGDTVRIPEGATVDGDLVVQNGQIEVAGEVNGNLTVIDGSVQLASAGHISGKSTVINEAIDWFWYKVGEVWSVATP